MKPLVANQPKLLPAWSRVTEVSVFCFKTGKPKNVQKLWHNCWVCEAAACQNSGFGHTGPCLEVFLNATKGIQIHAATEEFFFHSGGSHLINLPKPKPDFTEAYASRFRCRAFAEQSASSKPKLKRPFWPWPSDGNSWSALSCNWKNF